jgi:hypothetical protein
MVERQMISGRIFIGVAGAACVIAVLAANRVVAADNPRGFDSDENELDRPAAMMPSTPPMATLPSTTSGASTDTPDKGNPLWGIPIDLLHATRERPIFSPSRRPPAPPVIAAPPPPVKVVAPPPEPEQPGVDLLGIVEGGGEGYAVFINNTTHDIFRLKTGEGQDGWILRSVSGREAVLEKNHRTAVVELPPLTGDLK